MMADHDVATKPRRVQLRRTKGWRMPENTVTVARPTKWGNPFKIGDTYHRGPIFSGRDGVVQDAADAVRLFRAWIFNRRSANDVAELRGKNLACWCALDARAMPMCCWNWPTPPHPRSNPMPNEETVALRDCPFCGGEATLLDQKGPTGELYQWVECSACGATAGHCDVRSMQDDELHPIAAWNTHAAAMGWRDIASAPRDGTMFLGWHGGVGFWHWQDGTPPSRKTGWRNYMWVYPENEGPTHWMPLPTPPEPTT